MNQTYKCPTCEYSVQLTAHEAAQVGIPRCVDCGNRQCDPIDVTSLVALSAACDTEVLNGMVCDAKTAEAYTINQEGREAQIAYLVEHMGYDELQEELQQPQELEDEVPSEEG